MTETTTLVLGGTGKTGRRVVERLTRLDRAVRVGTRSAGVPFDWEDPSTWAAAMRGVGAAYVTFQPDPAVPGATEAVRDFSSLAVASGVRRLVLLSGRREDEALVAEKIVQDSGAEWTIVRASWFNQNSVRATCSNRFWRARLCFPPAMSPSRSSTPTTSLTSPSLR